MTAPSAIAAVTAPPPGVSIRLVPDNMQHIGARDDQQDSFYFSDPDNAGLVERAGILVVVADGMGGLAGGRQASLLACQTMRETYEAKTAAEPIPDALLRAVHAANDAVAEQARRSGLVGQIGTTIVAAVAAGRQLYWISVGDSRLYLYRNGEIAALTQDHDYARELDREAARGDRSWEEARSDAQRTALTSYLGRDTLTGIDHALRPLTLRAGDRLLLCSDGLYDALSNEEIAAVLGSSPPGAAAASLLEQVLGKQRPQQDNVTAAMLDVVAMGGPIAAVGATSAEGRSKRRLVLVVGAIVVSATAALVVFGLGPLPGVRELGFWPFTRSAAAADSSGTAPGDSAVTVVQPDDSNATAANPADDSVTGSPLVPVPDSGSTTDPPPSTPRDSVSARVPRHDATSLR